MGWGRYIVHVVCTAHQDKVGEGEGVRRERRREGERGGEREREEGREGKMCVYAQV